MWPETIAAIIRTRSDSIPDADNVPTSTWATTTGYGIYLSVTSQEPFRDGAIERVITRADFGVPADFPTVNADDQIVITGLTWEVAGDVSDFSLGPFNPQWVAVTGSRPGRVIHLRRVTG